jgi:hypothetical protein
MHKISFDLCQQILKRRYNHYLLFHLQMVSYMNDRIGFTAV